ncbi:MAG: PIG-L family deacetylase [Acidobacteriota bacterium]
MRCLPRLLATMSLVLLISSAVHAGTVRPSRTAYNLGETVELMLEDPGTSPISVRIGPAGGQALATVPLKPGQWTRAWTIPRDATLGLYEVESSGGNAKFVVYRQDLAIESLRTERNLYAVGDTVRVRVRMKNTGDKPLRDLKVVIGRGYPWISGFGRGSAISGEPSAQVYTYARPVSLRPGETIETEWFDTMKAALASAGKPDIFNMFCWISDKSGKDLYDLELTGTFIVQPANYQGPLPYHTQYALNKFLAETDYRGVTYKDLSTYEDATPAGAPAMKSWMAFAPHYDDELSFFPLVPRSQKEKAPFHIVQLTAGDGNVDSAHRYVDGVSNPEDWHTLGRLRRLETVHAAAIFGLQEGRDFSHLGLPDGGLLPIFEDTSGRNFFMFSTGTDRTPYDFVAKKNLGYHRAEIIQQLATMIRQRRPEDIYTPHPDEGHGDHRTTTWLVLEALRQLRTEDNYQPRVHVYVAYGAGDFPKAKYTYQKEPQVRLSDRTLVKLHFAEWAYQSQFSIAERGGRRLSLEELRRRDPGKWYLLKGW